MENSMSLLELLRHLEQRLDLTLTWQTLPWRTSDQRFFVADNTKAARLIRWQPQTPKQAGIETVLDWETASR